MLGVNMGTLLRDIGSIFLILMPRGNLIGNVHGVELGIANPLDMLTAVTATISLGIPLAGLLYLLMVSS
jgi:hypothetical protein